MGFKKIVLTGGGILGSQIAFQSAYCGFDVVIWVRSEASKGRTEKKLTALKQRYIDAIDLMDTPEGKYPANWAMGIADYESFDKKACLVKVEEVLPRIKIELDLKQAVKGADLVIEAIEEKKDAKIKFYKKLAPLLDEDTVLVTNSSTFLPSKFAKHTGRPEKFLSFHFANEIWLKNIAEIMGHKDTEQQYFDAIVKFAEEIRMVPIPVLKEQPGYLLNTVLQPCLLAAMDLVVKGVAEPESIDTAWKRGTRATEGPLEIVDIVGLETPYNIIKQYSWVPPVLYDFGGITKMLKKYIDEGKTGKQAGEGFYKYN